MNSEGSFIISWPDPSLDEDFRKGVYATGATEPWTMQVVGALMIASGERHILELGTYLGHGSAWLCCLLEACGGGTFDGVECDNNRARQTHERLEALNLKKVAWNVHVADAEQFLRAAEPRSYGFVWVDDDHGAAHVAQELELLTSNNNPGRRLVEKGGIICMHDVFGSFGLANVCEGFNGFALDLPRMHAGGGLGIIQVSK